MLYMAAYRTSAAFTSLNYQIISEINRVCSLKLKSQRPDHLQFSSDEQCECSFSFWSWKASWWIPMKFSQHGTSIKKITVQNDKALLMEKWQLKLANNRLANKKVLFFCSYYLVITKTMTWYPVIQCVHKTLHEQLTLSYSSCHFHTSHCCVMCQNVSCFDARYYEMLLVSVDTTCS